MAVLASSLVDFDALWKIVAVSIVAGAGVVGAFGFAILGISRYRQAAHGGMADRASSVALVALGGGFCLVAVVLGLIAMTHK